MCAFNKLYGRPDTVGRQMIEEQKRKRRKINLKFVIFSLLEFKRTFFRTRYLKADLKSGQHIKFNVCTLWH